MTACERPWMKKVWKGIDTPRNNRNSTHDTTTDPIEDHMKTHKAMHNVYWLSADERGASRHATHVITCVYRILYNERHGTRRRSGTMCAPTKHFANMQPRWLAIHCHYNEPVHLLEIESLWTNRDHSDWYNYGCRLSVYTYWYYDQYFYIILHERHQTAWLGWTESNGIERHPLDGWNHETSTELLIPLPASKNFELASRCHILTSST